MKRSLRWGAMSTPAKALIVAAGAAQVALAVTAWADLARRPPALVNGSKRTWAAVIAINFLGPILYHRRGRRSVPADHS